MVIRHPDGSWFGAPGQPTCPSRSRLEAPPSALLSGRRRGRLWAGALLDDRRLGLVSREVGLGLGVAVGILEDPLDGDVVALPTLLCHVLLAFRQLGVLLALRLRLGEVGWLAGGRLHVDV